MIKNLFILSILLCLSQFIYAQSSIEWSADYKLSKEDFKMEAPNSGQTQTATGSFSVSYEMGGINLITTRNLNKNVAATFQKNASYINKGNAEGTARFLKYQQLIFNTYELQARNLRKKFFENRTRLLTKGPSSMHQEALAEHNRLLSEIESETFNGSSSTEIEKWNNWTLQEIEKLSDFCKNCTPIKKKKKK